MPIVFVILQQRPYLRVVFVGGFEARNPDLVCPVVGDVVRFNRIEPNIR